MSIEQSLLDRCGSKCELCQSENSLSTYELSPTRNMGDDDSVILCNECTEQVKAEKELDFNHWRCINDSMWSEHLPVQVLAWRMLNRLSSEGWAQSLLEQLYLDDEALTWAKQGLIDENSSTKVLDSNGTELLDGDAVTIIKDLDVKGAGFTAKRGTTVKKISLTDDPTHIQGRVNGTQIYLKTCFLKKL